MRIIEIDIQKIRGLPDLNLKPDGDTLVIWGSNGAGKSGVVDAIDFVLTGRISRLVGQGTGGITLRRHGAHIDHDANCGSRACHNSFGWVYRTNCHQPLYRKPYNLADLLTNLVSAGESHAGEYGTMRSQSLILVFQEARQVDRNIASSASEMIFKERNASAPNSTGPNYVCFPGADHLGLLES